jgi:hypothetical protein
MLASDVASLFALPVRKNRPSRRYSFSDPNLSQDAQSAITFYLLGVGLSGLLVGTAFLGPRRSELQQSDYIGLGICVLFCLVFFSSFATFIWKGIPPKLWIRETADAEQYFSDTRFVLILWSFRQYEDVIGTIRAPLDKDLAENPIHEIGLDSTILQAAMQARLRLARWTEPQF